MLVGIQTIAKKLVNAGTAELARRQTDGMDDKYFDIRARWAGIAIGRGYETRTLDQPGSGIYSHRVDANCYCEVSTTLNSISRKHSSETTLRPSHLANNEFKPAGILNFDISGKPADAR